jgi:hypothetical protein
MNESFSSPAITAAVLANVIYGLLVLTLRYTRTKIGRFHPFARHFALAAICIAAMVANIVLYRVAGRWFPLSSTILLLIAFYALWSALTEFWGIGLIGADRHIGEGLNYTRSLQMCRNSLSFMGVGARKLTECTKEFEQAMQRCNRPNRPIRFLLCRLDSEILVKAARGANKDPGAYVDLVKESLRVIANLRRARQWNIEVRFYESLPLFRLMFIDDWLCLASHYVFGEGDGSEWPQLHIRRSQIERDVDSLYHPFQQHFDQLWEKSQIWNFEDYLGED